MSSIEERWPGRAVFDPMGVRIGHVTHVRRDPLAGASVEVTSDWGVLDWLAGMGAGHPRFQFRATDFEERGDRELVLKRDILEYAKEAA